MRASFTLLISVLHLEITPALGYVGGPQGKGKTVEQLDPEQLIFVEILAKLMAENEVFKEEYTAEDFAAVIDWLTKLRAQIDITIDSLQDDS